MPNWEELVAEALNEENLTKLGSSDPHPLDTIAALERLNDSWATAACKFVCEADVASSLTLKQPGLGPDLDSLVKVLQSNEAAVVMISAMTGLATLAEQALLKSRSPVEAVARFERLTEGPRIEIVGPDVGYRAFEEPVLAAEVERRTNLTLPESVLLTRGIGHCLRRMAPDRWGALTFESSGDEALARLIFDRDFPGAGYSV